ncbi:hypothetical protein IVA87_33855 [Bradyrhizobium sp. 147]|uniref:hypothetical protein n=1 Tax=Bradyrhizobium sp. 147 TaxID=2782623 RepID=UPI001FF8968F|nr:hypothetical protein [Bradyrhizobium sp. 147]MCK1684239.1 hypothetical protein [Bradyrhizobium sp. 147]
MTLFFVARTDAGAQDGMQRVFGAFDTRAEAEAFMAGLQAYMRGEFAIYDGQPVA